MQARLPNWRLSSSKSHFDRACVEGMHAVSCLAWVVACGELFLGWRVWW